MERFLDIIQDRRFVFLVGLLIFGSVAVHLSGGSLGIMTHQQDGSVPSETEAMAARAVASPGEATMLALVLSGLAALLFTGYAHSDLFTRE